MPRQYVTPADFSATSLGVGLGSANLAGGVLDKALWRASARVDKFCKRKIGACGSTTLAGSASLGASSISLTGSLGFDGTPDTVVVIGSGGTQETVQVGSISAIAATSPYAATLGLYPGVTLKYSHNSGEAVVQQYYEQQNVIGSSTSRMDQYFDFTQAGQIAEAHAPKTGIGENVRVVFLRQIPIQAIAAIAIVYPWANAQDTGVVSDLFVMPMEGWIRFPIGYFVPPDSVALVTYTAGYLTPPDDVQQAVMYECAAELAMGTNFLGAQSFKRGDYSVVFSSPSKEARGLLFCGEAEALLKDYKVLTI